jgi:predicted dehydrogenase
LSAPNPLARIPLGLIGGGLIGRTHVDRALRSDRFRLVGIADPAPQGRALAERHGLPWFPDHEALFRAAAPAAVIVATPNATHAAVAVDCLERGAAVLVEKPLADTLDHARAILDAEARTGRPVLTGHQRRHNPVMTRARALVASGALGRPVCVTVLCTWLKPADYFDVAWRRREGGGPVLINLIHDIDQLRDLWGEIATVQAMASNAVRGFEVEDTAVVTVRFANGALGTLTVTDAAVAPWNWDVGANEAQRFPTQEVASHFFSGTEGSLTLPTLEHWRYEGPAGWHDPITLRRTLPLPGCPYAEQLRHFAAVVDGAERPLCSALDGYRNLQVSMAVLASARAGRAVEVDALGPA